MPLLDTFQFSQSSLQDYVDCPRRFQLRYVLMQPWPALVTGTPGEFDRHVQHGKDFHRLAHQHALGIELDRLTATIHDETLARWWKTFLDNPPSNLPGADRFAEVIVTAPLGEFRLLAKFDLLAVDPGQRLTIVDWKTVLKRPQRTILARKLQTRVYRYLAVEAGAAFNDDQVPRPEQVEMIYWFAHQGGATEQFPYDNDQHAADRRYLADLIGEIATNQDEIWPLTSNTRQCRFCNYRSLCDRGVKAGFLADLDDDMETDELEIDLEQIAEIAF